MPDRHRERGHQQAGSDELRTRLLPGLADGSVFGGVALTSEITVSRGTAAGTAPAVLGGGLAHVLVLPAGDDAIVVDVVGGRRHRGRPGRTSTRRGARHGSRSTAHRSRCSPAGVGCSYDLARVLVAAEATGVAAECTEQAAAYAKVRVQFGRPIATFQAVKHHCANMLVASELATAAVWDAARAATDGGDQLSLAAAEAAASALSAADECAKLNIQVHGGIGFTWEHDAHLYLRRATALEAIAGGGRGRHVTSPDLRRGGTRRTRTIDLPPEAEPMRDEARSFAERLQGSTRRRQRGGDDRDGLCDAALAQAVGTRRRGGGAAGDRAGVRARPAWHGPSTSITGWVILTLIQHATEDQVARWVMPALRQDVIWCQLFSEPEAGSDAAGVTTRGTRVDGGWLVNGQKVWTSGAHVRRRSVWPPSGPTPTRPSTRASRRWSSTCTRDGVEVRPLRR